MVNEVDGEQEERRIITADKARQGKSVSNSTTFMGHDSHFQSQRAARQYGLQGTQRSLWEDLSEKSLKGLGGKMGARC